MRVSPRLLTLTMAVVFTAFLLMLIGWLLQEPRPLQVRQLPDGTVLRLEAVTHGPHQRFVRGRNWQRLLAPRAPRHAVPQQVAPHVAQRRRARPGPRLEADVLDLEAAERAKKDSISWRPSRPLRSPVGACSRFSDPDN